jgi:hypothetical protein
MKGIDDSQFLSLPGRQNLAHSNCIICTVALKILHALVISMSRAELGQTVGLC